eukprot:8666128-Pyramimonas_sp.AAC.1
MVVADLHPILALHRQLQGPHDTAHGLHRQLDRAVSLVLLHRALLLRDLEGFTQRLDDLALQVQDRGLL